MRWTIANGDILDRPADVLVLSGNPQLNLSGGVGGAFLLRYGNEMQRQMHRYLQDSNRRCVDLGDVITMPPSGSPYLAVIHAVGIDAFYETNPDAVASVITKSLVLAGEQFAKRVALAAIGTGYGKMSIHDFAGAVKQAMKIEYKAIENVEICLKKTSVAKELASLLPDVELV